MTAKTVRVRDAKDREFTTLAVEARRLGYEVLEEHDVPTTETAEGSETPAADLPEALEATPPAETPAAPGAPKTTASSAADKKKTKAAVIDSESAPTSEGTDR